MSINTVSIKIQTGVYRSFRNLNNKVWFALGEFVDNAVQNYDDCKPQLKKTHSGKYQFEVRIDIDWEHDQIKILDNAAGIDSENFQRAFEPANIPVDNTGLHEFGMGMKTASIWLADVWNVRTAALGENEIREVHFDLNKVLDEEKEILKVKNTPKGKSTHFTEIILSKLSNNAPTAYQMDKIRKHLASIYRKYIRSGELKLFINDVLLTYDEPEILNAPFYSNKNGRNILWKKPINFKHGNYKVKGFIGILNTMSTNEVNGLSLFRRGRVIEGSHDEKYRPKVICGQVGSPRYKRIFGELDLEGFTVSFNKGSFQEQEDLELLMEAIKVEISAKEFDLFTQAQEYRQVKTQNNNSKVAKGIVNSIKKSSRTESFKEMVVTSLKDIEDKGVASRNLKLAQKAKVIEAHEDYIEIKGERFKLKLELITEPSITDLYTLQEEKDELFTKKVVFKINLEHPFFARFDQIRTDNDYQPIISIIRALVLAELVAPYQGTRGAGNLRLNFNNFIRNI